MGNLQVNDEVYFFVDDSMHGQIIGRTDGKWDRKFRGEIEVTEKITTSLTESTNVQSTSINSSSLTAEGATVAGIPFATHAHTDAEGRPTSAPN